MKQSVHGGVGTREQQFTHLLPLREKTYLISALLDLSKLIKGEPDEPSDKTDPEENTWMPAGYTYFGQFVDHDLTFDNTSSLNPVDSGQGDRMPTNLRTPRFDLDSLYGDGPDAMPFMYDSEHGAALLFKDGHENKVMFSDPRLAAIAQAEQDFLRSPNGRAIIGDKRNDENVIVSQIHLLLLKYHNAVVKKLLESDPRLDGTALFERARREVRWTYQKLVLEDFLPRFVQNEVFQDLAAATCKERESLYALYTEDKRRNLPREFVVAAYRFGHSAVRQGYRVNDEHIFSIFPGSDVNHPEDDPDALSLLGFKPLPVDLTITTFSRFFPATDPVTTFNNETARRNAPGFNSDDDDPTRLQFAYKIDTNIVDPLGALPLNVLPTSSVKGGAIQELADTITPDPVPTPPDTPRPSLALLNLLRGNVYRVQSGQAIARVLQKRFPAAQVLSEELLVARVLDHQLDEKEGGTKFYRFQPIDTILQKDTPLWFYILAEAQATMLGGKVDLGKVFSEDELLKGDAASTQLGWVGGRIVAEVFFGLMDSDKESFIRAAPTGWRPMLCPLPEGQTRDQIVFRDLVDFVEGCGAAVEPPLMPPPGEEPAAGAEKSDAVVAAAKALQKPEEQQPVS